MKLSVLGATGSMSGPYSPASSYLVVAGEGSTQTALVLDMGPGGFGALWRVQHPATISAIALSHLHIDHCGDLMSMQIFRRWNPQGGLPAIPLLAPSGVVERMRGLDGFAGDDTFEQEFDSITLTDRAIFTVGCLQIQAFATRHTVESYALRIEEKTTTGTKVLTYSGDTDACDNLIAAADQADIFLCECGFTSADTARGIHLDGKRAAKIGKAANVKRMLLTHIQPWTDPALALLEATTQWDGPIEVAQPDGHYEI